jgi:signal transduction histidine kinase
VTAAVSSSGGGSGPAPGVPRPPASRTTLRWRLTLVYASVALGAGLLLLLLSVALVDRALSSGALDLPMGLAVSLPDGRVLTLEDLQRSLRDEALARLVRQGLLALLVTGGLGLLASWWLAGRVLRPLQEITTTAQRLSAERLDARIALQGPRDELRELSDVFDAMLDRLQGAFEAQRRFVADASHELRTPLAVMRTEVDVALADPEAPAEELRRAAEVVRAATDRADRLVDSLLLLARSDRLAVDGLPHRERVELHDVALAALVAVQSEIAERGLSSASSRAPAGVLGDRVLLERLAGNLVENAVRHNVDGGWLRVDTGTVLGRARLQVSSSGPVVPPQEVEQLFLPFRRSGPARTARRGAGLGLALVRAVATAHGGTVTATAPPEGGLVVTVELPRSP